MSKLAYSLHLCSDKNRKNVFRAKAKSNASGTTSLSNNAFQNARQLSRVDKHNYRKYDDNKNLIEIIRDTISKRLVITLKMIWLVKLLLNLEIRNIGIVKMINLSIRCLMFIKNKLKY